MNDVKNSSSENDTDVELIGSSAKNDENEKFWAPIQIRTLAPNLNFQFGTVLKSWIGSEIILKEPNRIMQDNRMLDR